MKKDNLNQEAGIKHQDELTFLKNWILDRLTWMDNNIPFCQATGNITGNPELLYIVDILGRHTNETTNTLLFYIYDNGTVEKRIILE
jgi:hypothetical protein